MENSKTYPFDNPPSMLIIFGGLPASGKTTIARDLARQLGATYLRIDTIEQALRESPTVSQPINEEGIVWPMRLRRTTFVQVEP